MTESLIDATDRLRRERRWTEASSYRDDLRRQLRADGRSKIEANELAWQAMIQKFPPQPVTEEESETVELVELDADRLAEKFDGIAPDLVGDALWVYDNLANKRAAVGQAPSLGAWSLLIWARGNCNRFFEQLFPKVIAAKQKQVDRQQWQQVEEASIEEVEHMLEQFSREHKEARYLGGQEKEIKAATEVGDGPSKSASVVDTVSKIGDLDMSATAPFAFPSQAQAHARA